MSTRWWSRSHDDEWLKVDLGNRYRISKVVIYWHSDYAEDYRIEVSEDGKNWRRVKEVEHGNGGMDELTFSDREARFVRVKCKEARDSDGYSIYEFEVYK